MPSRGVRRAVPRWFLRLNISRVVIALVGMATLLGACVDESLYDEDGLTGPGATLSSHVVSLEVSALERAELTDSIRVTVSARTVGDGEAIARLGMTALVTSPNTPDTAVIVLSETLATPVSGTVTRTFSFAPPVRDAFSLPDSLSVEVHAFAVDATGVCVAAVQPTSQGLVCSERGEAGFVATRSVGQQTDMLVTAGRTVRLTAGGVIADALVDTASARPRLFLSNHSRHLVEALDLRTQQWSQIKVGSQPWGLALDRSNSTLLVANSGGTSVSYVPTATLTEDIGRRLATPNTPIFEVTVAKDTLERQRYEARFYDFSDRPQFMAEDANGVLLYSTVPTQSAGTGTVRMAENLPGWEAPEVRILFTGRVVNTNPNVWAIAHVDSLRVIAAPENDLIIIYDHERGFPSRRIDSGIQTIEAAITTLRARGSDIYANRGKWVLDEIGLSDTTFVSASGDRRKVAFGEGAVAPAGRIMLWDATRRDLSNEISVADLVSNASERVMGVGLNHDGSLGVARGEQAVYFFNTGLRLQGLFSSGLKDGTGGATLRPGVSSTNTLAFVGTQRNTIQLIETQHYLQRGEIEIRDRVTGPLRSAPPLPEDNVGLSPSDPRYVVVKLYGVTPSGVVLVDVRNQDLR